MIGLAALLAACAGAPSAPPSVVTAAVRAELDAEPSARLFHAVDFSRDGVADWIVDFEPAGYVAWCGAGAGCRTMIFVSHAGGHRLVFDELTRMRAVKNGVLDVEVYGDFCHGPGAAPCYRRYVWNAAEGALDERPNKIGEDPATLPVFNPLPR